MQNDYLCKKNYNTQNASDWKEKPTKRELRER